MTEPIALGSTDGLSLEGELDRADDAVATLVLCHPHPQMGGTMQAPLLLALRDRMVSERFNVLRFNFRGIGASSGESSTGTAEVEDARGALAVARGLELPVAMAGWSFGAAVAVRVAATEELAGCVAIAPPIDEKPGITDGVGDASPACPTLVIVGKNDRQVSPERSAEWARERGADLVMMDGANHFFWGKYDDLAGSFAEWLVRVAH